MLTLRYTMKQRRAKLKVKKQALTMNVAVYPTELLDRWGAANKNAPVVYARLKNQHEKRAFDLLVLALGTTKAEFISSYITRTLIRIKHSGI